MARARYGREAALCIFALVSWVFFTTDGQYDLAKPTSAQICALLMCSTILWSLRLTDKLFKARDQQYSAIPLNDLNPSRRQSADECRDIDNGITRSQRTASHGHPWKLLAVVAALAASRIEVVRHVAVKSECSHRGIEALLPLVFGVYDAIYVQKNFEPGIEENDLISNNLFEDIYESINRSRLRYMIPCSFLSLGSFLYSTTYTRSSYICPILSNDRYIVPILQIICIFLDLALTIGTWKLIESDDDERGKLEKFSIFVAEGAIILFLFQVVSLNVDSKSVNIDLGVVFVDGLLLASFLFSLSQLISELSQLTAAVLFFYLCNIILQLNAAWESRTAFPPKSNGVNILAVLFVYAGFLAYMHINFTSDGTKYSHCFSKRISGWLYFAFAVGTTTLLILYTFRKNAVGFHPINLMMYTNRIEFDHWLKQASSSGSLQATVTEYRVRHHGRPPPPNFDKWHKFATEKGSIVMDDYDQIRDDLLPYWSVRPEDVRTATVLALESLSDVAGIKISGGTATSVFRSTNTEISSLEDIIERINTFAQWLPDMTIAINLRDTPQSRLQWKALDSMTTKGSNNIVTLPNEKNAGFSEQQSPPWSEISTDLDAKVHGSKSSDASISSSRRLLAASCPPGSSIGQQTNDHSRFCRGCIGSYSVGQFVQNWTKSTQICDQSDILYLHDFLLRPDDIDNIPPIPAPLFGRAKTSGFVDILMPWRQEAVATDMAPFEKLQKAFYWRSSASDIVAESKPWRGMQEQRLVHFMNNASDEDIVSVLLPDDRSEGRFIYESVRGADLKSLFDIDAEMTSLVGCKKSDCDQEGHELGAVPPVNVEEMVKHQYVFALDPRGPSPHFLSFLRSNSVPFRATIYREWFDSRLAPWLHFVPQDIRFHAIYSTLAYFMGMKGSRDAKDVEFVGREADAKFIAEQGKRWAEKALRPEDMEVYLFRLLLEWGRIVDDKRQEIGFTL